MKLTKQQEANLLELDISGKGGKDAEIAIALGFERESAKYHDALDKNGKKWEFKKQQNLNERLKRLLHPKMMGKNFKVIFAKNKKCKFSLAFK